MNIESKELKEYISSTLEAIKKGVSDTGFEITKPIEFNLAITNKSEGGGGLKIYVVNAEGKTTSEEISHIKFQVEPKINFNYPPQQFKRITDSNR